MSGPRKQFRLLGGYPLLVQTTAAFRFHPRCTEVVVAVPEDGLGEAREAFSAAGLDEVTVVAGGATRQESVRSGLEAIAGEARHVLIHDAVRPFIARNDISRLLATVQNTQAAVLGVPVRDTLRSVRDHEAGWIEASETIDRKSVYAMQTPQAFGLVEILGLHREAAEEGVDCTDDAELWLRAGRAVAVVPGSTMNFKITTAADWSLATAAWPEWERQLDYSVGASV